MKYKMDQSPAINSNPVLNVAKDGVILYSNEAGEPLLNEWGVRVGEKLPSSIVDPVQRVISRNSPEKMEVKVGKSVYLVVFHPLSVQECVNISGFDITDQKELEEKPPESKEIYQELFNLIEQAVQIGEIVFDEEGQPIDNIILDVNLAYEKLSGFRREEVIGRSFKERFPIVEKTWLDRYGEVVRTGMGIHFEEQNASLDRWFEVFAGPLGGNRFIAVFSDITRHKRTEENLLKSEQHSRLLYETMLQGVVYQDASGKIISMNPAAERILGKTPAEFLGSSSVCEEHLTIREDGSPFPGFEHPAMVSLQTGQKVQDVVMGVYNPRENCYRWININAVPIFRTGEDKPFQVYTLFDDITERKRTEDTLQESKARVDSIFKSSPVGIGVVVGRIIKEANERLCEMTGYSREELLGRNALTLYPTAEEYERVGLVKYSMIAEHSTGHVETCWRRKDGSIVDILLSSSPIIPGDLSGEITFTSLDITERKRAEEALKKAHDSLEEKVKERTSELENAYISLKESEEHLSDSQKIAHIGNWEWNIVTNEEYWSDEVYRIFGLDPQFGLNHITFLNCIHPDDLGDVNNAINEALNGKPYNIDYRIILPDGKERVIYSEGGVFFDEKNTPLRMRGIFQDISERKKAEESLANVEIIRKKEIHHRIKNNLQVISSLLDLQAEQFRNRENIKDSEVLEAFRESQDRVASIALIHEELHEGKETDELNFSQYLERLVENLFHTYRFGNINISLNLDLEENVFFDMDIAVPLGMVVNELVSNSLKHAFIGRDRGEIQIKLHREESTEFERESRKITSTSFILTISDNGIGIPENLDIEDLASLGMQLVTSLVDQLDGEFELKGNNGTEFIIRFAVTEKGNLAHSA